VVGAFVAVGVAPAPEPKVVALAQERIAAEVKEA
jgi:hypothetical protein